MRPLRLIALGAAIAASAVLAGCSSSAQSMSSGDVATMLEEEIPRQNQGSTFTGATCVERGAGEYRCSGTYKASLASVREELPEETTVGWTDRDWNALIAGRSGKAAFDVTVDSNTGDVVWVPAG